MLKSGLTQREFARRLGVSEGHVSNVVRGKRRPSLALVLRISELTGIDVGQIVGGPARARRGRRAA